MPEGAKLHRSIAVTINVQPRTTETAYHVPDSFVPRLDSIDIAAVSHPFVRGRGAFAGAYVIITAYLPAGLVLVQSKCCIHSPSSEIHSAIRRV